ncbi:MAG: phosphatase PAP2 family protein [Gemmatimonadota bacterium]
MVPKEAGSFVHAPAWMVFGPPALALVLLIGVELGSLDQPLFFFFNSLSSYTGPTFWANVTILGDGLVCAVLLLPWIRRNPERIWGGLLGAVLMVVVLRGFKDLLSLPRPLGVLAEDSITVIGPGLRRSTFPSGHTATMALLAGVWALSASRRFVSWLALFLAVLVGVSRMAVGVHWPTDVLAGFALGWASAWIGLRWAFRARWGMGRAGRRILTGALLISATVLLVIDHTGYPGVLLFQRSIALVCLVWGALGVVRASPEEFSPGHAHTGS